MKIWWLGNNPYKFFGKLTGNIGLVFSSIAVAQQVDQVFNEINGNTNGQRVAKSLQELF